MIDDFIPTRQEKPSNTEVLGFLLNSEDINLKTDLNIVRIKNLMQIRWFSLVMNIEDKRTPIEKLDDVIEYYKELLASDNRKSRIETIDGLKHIQEEQQPMLTNFVSELKK